MKVQIIKNKKSGKVVGWGEGQGWQTREGCETLLLEVSQDIFDKVKNPDYEISLEGEQVIATKRKSVVDAEAEKKERDTIREKVKKGTATQKEKDRALELLL